MDVSHNDINFKDELNKFERKKITQKCLYFYISYKWVIFVFNFFFHNIINFEQVLPFRATDDSNWFYRIYYFYFSVYHHEWVHFGSPESATVSSLLRVSLKLLGPKTEQWQSFRTTNMTVKGKKTTKNTTWNHAKRSNQTNLMTI